MANGQCAQVYVVGARGRMGQLVCAQVEASEGLELAGGYDVDNIAELDEEAPAAPFNFSTFQLFNP